MIVHRLIQHYGDEKSFIKKFIHALTAADSRITCNKTDSEIDTMFADTSSSPTFVFTVGDMYTITFVRNGNPTIGTSDYMVTFKSLADTGTATRVNKNLFYSSSGYHAGTETTRTYWLSVAANNKAIAVILGNHDNPTNCGVYFLQGVGFKDDDNNVWFSACKNRGDAVGSGDPAFYGTFWYVGTTYTVPIDRLQYVSDSTNTRHIEIIKNKAVKISGQTSKFAQTDAIYDCSTLPLSSSGQDVTKYLTAKELIIGSRRYYALTPNTLIPV